MPVSLRCQTGCHINATGTDQKAAECKQGRWAPDTAVRKSCILLHVVFVDIAKERNFADCISVTVGFWAAVMVSMQAALLSVRNAVYEKSKCMNIISNS